MKLLQTFGLLLASGSVVSAMGQLGFALGDKNADGSCKLTSDYEADFDAILAASGSKLVRGYAASDCNTAQQILPAAKSKGFQVILGVWPDVETSFTADTQAIQQYMPGYEAQVFAITVGSETMYRGTFTGPQLLAKINQVKQMFPGTLIGTADSWNKYADGTADAVIGGGVDLLLVNAFSYWQATPISNATHNFFSDVFGALQQIENVLGQGNMDKLQFWVGETGWPTTGGSNYGAAMASTANAATFFSQGVCSALRWNVNVFYFEIFDEPWKPASVGDDGQAEDETHWGAMTADRQLKFPLTC